MTVSTAYSPILYAGNDATTAFSVTWPFFTGTLVVTLVAANGTETVKSLTTHYTVSGGTDSNGLPATGTVTMLTAPATGETLRIERAVPLTQAATWAENDAFPQKTVEGVADKALLISQELAYDVARAIKQSVADYEDNGELSLPSPEASKFLGWNDDGTAIENKDGADYTLTIGTVTTGAAGSSASATITGTTTAGILNLTIPRGNTGASGAGTGDLLGPGVSVDGEIALFDGIDGTNIKRATTTGLLKAASGVLAAAVAGTDYVAATSGSAVQKANGSGGLTAASDGTDFLSSSTGVKQGRHTIWVPAAAMVPSTTNGAAAATFETSSNDVMFQTLDFDATGTEYAQFAIRMPKSWDEGTVTAAFVWSHASTTTNFGVQWGLAGTAFSNDDAGDAAFSTAETVDDTGGTTNDIYITSETSAITIAGTPQAEDLVIFRAVRRPAEAADTLAIDARLHGVTLYITTNAATDA